MLSTEHPGRDARGRREERLRCFPLPLSEPDLKVKLILDPFQAKCDAVDVVEPKLVLWMGGCPLCGKLRNEDVDEFEFDAGDEDDEGSGDDDTGGDEGGDRGSRRRLDARWGCGRAHRRDPDASAMDDGHARAQQQLTRRDH